MQGHQKGHSCPGSTGVFHDASTYGTAATQRSAAQWLVTIACVAHPLAIDLAGLAGIPILLVSIQEPSAFFPSPRSDAHILSKMPFRSVTEVRGRLTSQRLDSPKHRTSWEGKESHDMGSRGSKAHPLPVRRTRSPCREQDTLPYALYTPRRPASMRQVHEL